jgi:hypothetical protein
MVRRQETVRQYFAIARYNLAARKRVDYATNLAKINGGN